MTNERAIEIINSLKEYYNDRNEDSYVGFDDEDNEALDIGIKALEQQPITWIVGKDNCQVAVRNMPIDKMQKICGIIGEEEQQPKTGHWITDVYMFGRGRHTCSNCGKGQEYTTAFCSWCGADMRESEETE